jgi:hypothetical protein
MDNVLGEIWFSPENRAYRYQLTSSAGEVLFYQAYDGEYTTQSVHLRPVGKQSIKQIYRFKGFVPLWLERPGDGGLLANPSPVYYWLLAVRQAMDRKSDCTDLYCLLGLPKRLELQESRCKYSFGDVEGLGTGGLKVGAHPTGRRLRGLKSACCRGIAPIFRLWYGVCGCRRTRSGKWRIDDGILNPSAGMTLTPRAAVVGAADLPPIFQCHRN